MKKNKTTKRNHAKFASRSSASGKDRASQKKRAERELKRALAEIGIDPLGAKIKLSYDDGYSGSSKRRNIPAKGIYSETANGYGFVSIGEGKRDVFIPQGASLDAIDGDTVEIAYSKFISRFGEEKTEGRVTRVIEYARDEVIGTVCSESLRRGRATIRRLYLSPDDPRLHRRFYIVGKEGFEVGDLVLAKIKRGKGALPECYITESFGKGGTRDASYKAILKECGIEDEFSEEELRQAEEAAKRPVVPAGRVVRDEVIFTIDGEGVKDIDDAISLKKLDDGWLLGVHIADVSYYVDEKCALDRLATRRGTSVYFTDKVVPMLPRALSNGACSLHPGAPKYTLSAMIRLTREGEIESLSLEPSIINSCVQGVYSEINKIFLGEKDTAILKKYEKCLPTLRDMHELYRVLAKKSLARGAVSLDSAEGIIVLDENGTPTDIIKAVRGDAEKMIEQFMLTANEAVASYLSERKIPCVYRVHDAPPAEKLEDFIVYARSLELDTKDISKPDATGRDFEALLEKARERGISEAVSYTLLRSMAKAEYSDKRSSHFGLGIKNYCHFTSPIRRLSDLATHRIIHRVLLDGKEPLRYASYAGRMAAAATEGEIRAVTAERRIENLYKAIYMSERIGEIYPAVINSITSFGMFATLENTCEGLIPISELCGVFIFDEKTLKLRSSKKQYSIGDRISIRVEEADTARGKLRFSVYDEDKD